jgi:hypothetical protein
MAAGWRRRNSGQRSTEGKSDDRLTLRVANRPHAPASPADVGCDGAAVERWRGADATEPSLIDTLYNLTWIPDGSLWQKHAYVIFAPWCPVCKALFHDSRSLVSQLQLRWIPAGSRKGRWRDYNAVLGRSRDEKALAQPFTTGSVTTESLIDFNSIDLNEGVIFSQKPALQRLLGQPYAFLTLIHASREGMVATFPPDDIGSLAGGIVTNESYSPDGSEGPQLLARSAVETPIMEKLSAVAKGDVAISALPFTDGPKVGVLTGRSYGALARIETDAGTWIALDYLTNGVRAYVPADRTELRPSA